MELSQVYLKSILHYCPETGAFTRIKKIARRGCVGDLVGSPNNEGYLHTSIGGTAYKLHRLVFLYMHGAFPAFQIDHINGDRADNRLSNLRAATNTVNSRNRRKQKTNTSGHMGVYFYKPNGKWQASIRVDGRNKSCGYFFDKQDAIAARQAAEKAYGFHPNHGR